MTISNNKSNLTRREFLIALGGLAGAAVVGWIAGPKTVELFSELTGPSQFPALLDCLQIRNGDNVTELYDISDPAAPVLVCRVNEVGGSILRRLDGRTSLKQIAQAMIRNEIGEVSDLEMFASKIALFTTELAKAGFLKEPFFVNLVENAIVT